MPLVTMYVGTRLTVAGLGRCMSPGHGVVMTLEELQGWVFNHLTATTTLPSAAEGWEHHSCCVALCSVMFRSVGPMSSVTGGVVADLRVMPRGRLWWRRSFQPLPVRPGPCALCLSVCLPICAISLLCYVPRFSDISEWTVFSAV